LDARDGRAPKHHALRCLFFSYHLCNSDTGCFLHKVLAREGWDGNNLLLFQRIWRLNFPAVRPGRTPRTTLLQGTGTTVLEGNCSATGQSQLLEVCLLRSALLLLGRRKNLGRLLSSQIATHKGRRGGTNGPQAGATSSLPTTSPFRTKLYPIQAFFCTIETPGDGAACMFPLAQEASGHFHILYVMTDDLDDYLTGSSLVELS
jgi:hypothetical protein